MGAFHCEPHTIKNSNKSTNVYIIRKAQILLISNLVSQLCISGQQQQPLYHNDHDIYQYFIRILREMQQELEPKLVKCEHCEKQIQSHKIDTHFSYCARNFKRCSLCLVFYDTKYEEEHQEQMHQQIKCQHCDRSFQKGEYQVHRKGCGPKFVICPSCDQNVPEIMFQEHQRICAARTVECEICHKPFLVQKFKSHEEMCLLRLANPDLYPEQECYGNNRVKQEKPPVNRRSIALDLFSRPAQRGTYKQTHRQTIEDLLPVSKGRKIQHPKRGKQESQAIDIDDEQQIKSTSEVVEPSNKKKDDKNKKEAALKPNKQDNKK